MAIPTKALSRTLKLAEFAKNGPSSFLTGSAPMITLDSGKNTIGGTTTITAETQVVYRQDHGAILWIVEKDWNTVLMRHIA